MNETKDWWTSKGVWGGIISAVAGIGGLFFGLNVSVEVQEQLAILIPGLLTTLGGVIAIIGRVKAEQKIGPPT